LFSNLVIPGVFFVFYFFQHASVVILRTKTIVKIGQS